MTDGIGMRPADTARETHGLGHHGHQLDTAWQRAKSVIAGNESGIGGDVLGRAFRTRYARDSEAVRRAADGVPPAIVTDAGLGSRATHDYDNADAAGYLGDVG